MFDSIQDFFENLVEEIHNFYDHVSFDSFYDTDGNGIIDIFDNPFHQDMGFYTHEQLSQLSLHDQGVYAIASKLHLAGYSVQADLTGWGDSPPALPGNDGHSYIPDVVATDANGHIHIFEVESEATFNSAHSEAQALAFSKAAADIGGTFNVIYAGSEHFDNSF